VAWVAAFLIPAISLPWLKHVAPDGFEGAVREEPVSWQHLLAQAWPIGVAGLCVMLYTKFDLMLLARLVPGPDTGYYAAAARVNEVAYGVAASLMVSLVPLLVRLRDSGRFHQVSRFGIRIAGLGGLMLVVAVFGSTEVLMPTLFGDAYRRSTPLLCILVVGQPLAVIGLFTTAVLTTLGLQRAIMEATILAAVWNVVANLSLIHAYGVIGTAWASVTSVTIPIVYLLIRSETRWLPRLAGRELALGGLQAAAAIALGTLVPIGAAFGLARVLVSLTLFVMLIVALNRRELHGFLTALSQTRAS
jgi:O-antigen/teichoic acid export membrane protein